MSIYMQGSHRLALNDGRFVLLESNDLDLNLYADKHVAVLGAVRPTVEGDAMIMRVEQITLLDTEESSSSESSSSEISNVNSSTESSEAMSSNVSSIVVSSAAKSSAKPVVSSAAISSAQASSAPVASSAAAMTDNHLEAATATMAKAGTDDAQWTQRYCSTHIGFCFPVHKNWWFKSFGTTTSYLWHVEISTQDITELGGGPLVVNLMAGSLASAGAADGEVRTQGEFVVGYKAWNDTSHFEVSAPKSLEASVRYIVDHIEKQ